MTEGILRARILVMDVESGSTYAYRGQVGASACWWDSSKSGEERTRNAVRIAVNFDGHEAGNIAE